MDILDRTIHPKDVLEKYPESTKIYDMFALCTDPEYRGRGLGTNMIKEAWKVAKKANCDIATVLASSNYSRKIFNNLGMDTFAKMDWNEMVYEGKVAFKNVDSDFITTHCIKL